MLLDESCLVRIWFDTVGRVCQTVLNCLSCRYDIYLAEFGRLAECVRCVSEFGVRARPTLKLHTLIVVVFLLSLSLSADRSACESLPLLSL